MHGQTCVKNKVETLQPTGQSLTGIQQEQLYPVPDIHITHFFLQITQLLLRWTQTFFNLHSSHLGHSKSSTDETETSPSTYLH